MSRGPNGAGTGNGYGNGYGGAYGLSDSDPSSTDGGADSGPAGGPPDGAGGPSADGLITTLETILADGGLTLAADAVERLTDLQADLADTLTAGGTDLPDMQTDALERMADRLEALAAGDMTGDGFGAPEEAPRLLDGFSGFIDQTADLVSDAMADRLAEVSAILTSALGDGSVDEEDAQALATAATLLGSAASDTFVKLSDEGLATLAAQAADVDTLLTDGFLPFDDADLTAVADLLASLQADSDGGTIGDPGAMQDAIEATGLDFFSVFGEGPGGGGGAGGGHGQGGPAGPGGQGGQGGQGAGDCIIGDAPAPDDTADGPIIGVADADLDAFF